MEDNNIDNIYNQESKDFKQKSEEELAKERKKRKLELITGAIGDIGSAFSNLFLTTKGAPSTIPTTGKNRQMTLMDRIKSRHKEEDECYGKKLSAWEKEQEKKRKIEEKAAKENEVLEDIHPDFRPKVKNWEKKDYIDVLYAKLRYDIQQNAIELNRKKQKGELKADLVNNRTLFIPDKDSTVIDYLDGFNTEGAAGRHIKAELIRDILSGNYQNDELSDEWLDRFRKTAQEDDDKWANFK
ncbi:MAG: hypothetical protein HDS84_01390 [Bacteroidales bacterium]|nr:hypothetical protein [Bacteroidales bacterium]